MSHSSHCCCTDKKKERCVVVKIDKRDIIGPTGPQGVIGPQGVTGPTGPSGVVLESGCTTLITPFMSNIQPMVQSQVTWQVLDRNFWITLRLQLSPGQVVFGMPAANCAQFGFPLPFVDGANTFPPNPQADVIDTTCTFGSMSGLTLANGPVCEPLSGIVQYALQQNSFVFIFSAVQMTSVSFIIVAQISGRFAN